MQKDSSYTRTFRSALFDLDGTLIDTESQYSMFWRGIGERYGFPGGFAMSIKGTTLTDIFDRYFPEPALRTEVTAALDKFESEMEYPLMPGVMEFLADIRSHGVRTAVVTSSNKAKMENVRRRLPGFLESFDAVLTSEDFPASKPDPACYRIAAECLGSPLQECIVFEDAPNGLRAGTAAGIFTICVGNAETGECPYDYHIDGFSGLGHSDIIRALQPGGDTCGTYDVLLKLVRIGLGQEDDLALPERVDWPAIYKLSRKQALAGVVLDGVQRLFDAWPDENALPPALSALNGMSGLKSRWFSYVISSYDRRYAEYRAALGRLAHFYNSHGYRMMILKGYGLSLDWPEPHHRPCGDMDIWLFGQWKEADAALSREKGIDIDNSHHHHTVFDFEGYMVENHYDFVNVYSHRSSRDMENVFKRLGMDDSRSCDIDGERVVLPSANLGALFLLRHTLLHFAAEGVNLRQILDWGFFIKAHSAEIDEEWFEGELERFGMKAFRDCLNAVCAYSLGFDAALFPCGNADADIVRRVLADTLCPEYDRVQPRRLLERILWKLRRWKGNIWKHRLCYSENLLSAFFVSAWAHLIKPSSI